MWEFVQTMMPRSSVFLFLHFLWRELVLNAVYIAMPEEVEWREEQGALSRIGDCAKK